MANKRQPKGRINAKGKQVYDAPIRIVDNNDLRNYGITWKDCETLYVGGIEPMNVYMYETDDPKLADSFWKEINVEHHRNCRSTRCLVPGTLKPLIVCPECNKCSECPYGKKNEYRQTRVINYDDPEELMSNEGDEFSGMNEAESEMIYDELIAAMNRKNPLIAEVFVRFHTYDLSAPEIAAELGIDKRAVYYLKEQGEQIRDRLMNL
jgi:hypothetical protein